MPPNRQWIEPYEYTELFPHYFENLKCAVEMLSVTLMPVTGDR